jgi:hypothetical protein
MTTTHHTNGDHTMTTTLRLTSTLRPGDVIVDINDTRLTIITIDESDPEVRFLTCRINDSTQTTTFPHGRGVLYTPVAI